MKTERMDKIKKIFIDQGPIIRSTLLRKNKFYSKDINELITQSYLKKIKTGYYIWSSFMNNLSDLEIAASVIPNAVVCMLSAASYHELTTINPISIDIAVPSEGISPILPAFPPINLYKVAKNIYGIGKIEIKTANSTIHIYDKERTVCDFFRLRLQLGEDVALEILRNYMLGIKNMQRLYEYAAKLRIKNVIKPYVQAMI